MPRCKYLHKRLSIHFAARVGSDMNLAASFRCTLCFWSVLSNVQCCANPVIYCCVSCSSRLSAPSRKLLRTVFEPGATVTFHFVRSSCFLPLKPNPSAIASECGVLDRASRRNLQRSIPLSCAGIPLTSENQGRCVHRF